MADSCISAPTHPSATNAALYPALFLFGFHKVRPNSAVINWEFPTERNGEIRKFELWTKLGCPTAPQPITVPCPTNNDKEVIYSGLELSFKMEELKPYTTYSTYIRVFNTEGM